MTAGLRRAPGLALAGWLLAAAPAQAAAFDAALYARLLERHTRAVADTARTRVDYAALAGSSDWQRLIAGLATVDPGELRERSERLAFWINAYNALAIDLVARHYPVRGIREIGSLVSPVWDREAGTIGGRAYSLGEIEHGILRPLGDPRVHAAIVCASVSCPALRREPWSAPGLDAQLDAAMAGFLADPDKGLRIDRRGARVALSRIFDWFAADFEARGGALAFASPYLPEADRAWLEAHRHRLRIEYLDYDWSLNDGCCGRGASF